MTDTNRTQDRMPGQDSKEQYRPTEENFERQKREHEKSGKENAREAGRENGMGKSPGEGDPVPAKK